MKPNPVCSPSSTMALRFEPAVNADDKAAQALRRRILIEQVGRHMNALDMACPGHCHG
jgi:hypothetical protein